MYQGTQHFCLSEIFTDPLVHFYLYYLLLILLLVILLFHLLISQRNLAEMSPNCASKMAPGGVLACRRSVYRLLTLCFLDLLCFLNHIDCLRLMYDQVYLLNLRQMVSDTNTCDFHIKLFAEQRWIPHLPFKLCGSPGCACWFTRRRRKRGNYGKAETETEVRLWMQTKCGDTAFFLCTCGPSCILATFDPDYVDEAVGKQRGGLRKSAPLETSWFR